MKVRAAPSRPCSAGQINNGQRFCLKSGLSVCQNQDSGQICEENPDRQLTAKSGQNPDSKQTPDRIFRKIRTKTRQGWDTDSAVRRRLLTNLPIKRNFEIFRPCYFRIFNFSDRLDFDFFRNFSKIAWAKIFKFRFMGQ